MKHLFRHGAVHALLLACFALCTGHARAQEAAPAHVDPVTELRFPQQLSKMRYQGVRDFGDKKMGYCVLYASEGARGQFCVYDLGHEQLPTGIDSPAFKKALQISIDGFVQSLNAPPFSNGKIIGHGTPSIDGDGKTASAEMRLLSSELTLPGKPTVHNAHMLLMTTGLEKFLKFNYTEELSTADAFAAESRQILDNFVRFNGATMKKLLVEPRR